jgi:hypothetical protein
MILQLLLWQVGMPANCIVCIFHMLCDECILACLLLISVSIQAPERSAMLDHQKETGKSLSDAAYADIFKNYKESLRYFQRCRCNKRVH